MGFDSIESGDVAVVVVVHCPVHKRKRTDDLREIGAAGKETERGGSARDRTNEKEREREKQKEHDGRMKGEGVKRGSGGFGLARSTRYPFFAGVPESSLPVLASIRTEPLRPMARNVCACVSRLLPFPFTSPRAQAGCLAGDNRNREPPL